MADELLTYTIYEHPSDYPRHFVVRVWKIGPGTMTAGAAEGEVALADTLDEARALLPLGLACVGRQPDDDPVIVETWI